MSYAAVAGNNAPPLDQQPHPDPNLLNTHHPHSHLVDDTTNTKVNLAPPDFKQNPITATSQADVIPQYPEQTSDDSHAPKKSKAEEESNHLWPCLTWQLLRTGVASGLVGIVNVGLIASAGYAFYSRPSYRSDTKVIGSTLASTLLILGSEVYLAEAHNQTEQRRFEAQRACGGGTYLYKRAKEVVLRPGVLGGIIGVFNCTILGTVGYFAYKNWHLPRWDRHVVSVLTIGLLGLLQGEGYLVELYKGKEHYKQK